MELTLTGALVVGINVLAGVVAFLFFRIERINKERAKESESKWKRITRLERWAHLVGNCPLSNCPFESVNIPEDDGEETKKLQH